MFPDRGCTSKTPQCCKLNRELWVGVFLDMLTTDVVCTAAFKQHKALKYYLFRI